MNNYNYNHGFSYENNIKQGAINTHMHKVFMLNQYIGY